VSAGGHIRRRGDSWELKYDLGCDPETGRRRTRYATIRGTRRDAERELRRLLAAADRGEHVDQSKITIAQHVAERIGLWRTSGRISARSAEHYYDLARHQIAHIGGIQLQKLTTDAVERWHAGLLAAGPRTASARTTGPRLRRSTP
jgi:integrase